MDSGSAENLLEVDQGPHGDYKRKRVTQACDVCNKKKIKCDGKRPKCQNCTSLSQKCTYSRTAKKRGPRPGYIEDLENRVRQLETLLKEIPVTDASSSNAIPGAVPVYDTRSSAQAQSLSSQLSSSTRIPSISTSIASATLSTGQLPSPAAPSPSSAVSRESLQLIRMSDPLTRQIRLDLLNVFFEKVHPVYPILHKQYFFANLERHSALLLESMYALAAKHTVQSPHVAYTAGDGFASRARSCVYEALETAQFPEVAGLFFLAAYIAESGHMTESWVYFGMALRIGQQLNLHNEVKEPSSSLNEYEREMRRRLWWSMYQFDRENCVGSRLPFALRESDFDVQYPCPENVWSIDLNDPQSPLRQMLPSRAGSDRTPNSTFGHMLSLYHLVSEIVSIDMVIQTPSVTIHPNVLMNMERDMDKLDEKLRQWGTQVPAVLITPQARYTSDFSSSELHPWISAFVVILYHYGILRIHQRRLAAAISYNASSATSHPSYTLVVDSANVISSMTRKFLYENPEFQFVSGFISRCIALGGLAHLTTLDVYPQPADAQKTAVLATIEMHLDALNRLRLQHYFAGQDYSALQAAKTSKSSFLSQTLPLQQHASGSASETAPQSGDVESVSKAEESKTDQQSGSTLFQQDRVHALQHPYVGFPQPMQHMPTDGQYFQPPMPMYPMMMPYAAPGAYPMPPHAMAAYGAMAHPTPGYGQFPGYHMIPTANPAVGFPYPMPVPQHPVSGPGPGYVAQSGQLTQPVPSLHHPHALMTPQDTSSLPSTQPEYSPPPLQGYAYLGPPPTS